MTPPQQSIDRLLQGIAAVAVGLLIFLTAGLYEWLTEDDPAPATTASQPPPQPDAAQMMADLDAHLYPASAYQQQLDSWSAKCTQGEDTLAGYVHGALQDLQKNGIRSDTEYKVLADLNRSTPDGAHANCEDIAAAYLVLREAQ
jgi:hypothetical protein